MTAFKGKVYLWVFEPFSCFNPLNVYNKLTFTNFTSKNVVTFYRRTIQCDYVTQEEEQSVIETRWCQSEKHLIVMLLRFNFWFTKCFILSKKCCRLLTNKFVSPLICWVITKIPSLTTNYKMKTAALNDVENERRKETVYIQ